MSYSDIWDLETPNISRFDFSLPLSSREERQQLRQLLSHPPPPPPTGDPRSSKDEIVPAEEQPTFHPQPPTGDPGSSPNDIVPADPGSSMGATYWDSTHKTPATPPRPPQKEAKVPWSSSLFGCFSDIRNCCITCWCPCVTFGRIAEIVDRGSSSCGVTGGIYVLIACVSQWCCCLYSCFYRTRMRQQYSLKELPCPDCMVHFCCEYCALCQEYRELKARGFNMSIGWQGNLLERQRQNHGVLERSGKLLSPTVELAMRRDD